MTAPATDVLPGGNRDPETPRIAACAHCGLPVRGAVEGRESYCCSGCFLVAKWIGPGEEGPSDRLISRVIVCAFLSMGIMVVSLAMYAEAWVPEGEVGEAAMALRGLMRMVALLLSLPVAALLGVPLLEAVIRLKRWGSMDALVLMGVGATWVVSVWNTCVQSGPVYFESATMILVLVSLGRWMDTRSREVARKHLGERVAEEDPRAWVLRGDREVEVGVEELAVGDEVRVRPGEVLPVDGRVVLGRSEIDASSLTGEERPVEAVVGDEVWAGTVLLEGSMVVRTTARVGERLRDRTEELLREALERPAGLVRLADRWARVLLPTVSLLALGVGATVARSAGAIEGLQRSLAILLVACPCALGIATPLAFWRALGEAWRRGVLVRGADVLERLARAKHGLFDKTGTLTEEGLVLEGVESGPGHSRAEDLELAASLDWGSDHGVARALRRAWLEDGEERRPRDVVGFETRNGVGVRGEIDGRGFELRRPRAEELVGWKSPGGAEGPGTSALLLEEDQPRALFRFGSRVRSEAPSMLARLRDRGLALEVLTGDGADAGARLGETLGIPVKSELGPGAKVARVRALGPTGTLFVGDGLNDAAALAAADVGVAMGHGSPRSLEAADAVLMQPGIDGLLDLHGLAVRTVGVARWNLTWTVAYNTVAVVLAAQGRLAPVIAALLMVLSSVFVVGHTAWRLNPERWSPGNRRSVDNRPAPNPERPRSRTRIPVV